MITLTTTSTNLFSDSTAESPRHEASCFSGWHSKPYRWLRHLMRHSSLYNMLGVVAYVLLMFLGTTAVQAGDTRGSRRDVVDVCNQFVIEDPAPGIRVDYGHNDSFLYDDVLDDRDNPRR